MMRIRTTAVPKPQVLQPPPLPQQEPVDLPPTAADDRGSEDEDGFDAALLWMIPSIGTGALTVLAVLLTPFIVIGVLKAARRRRRRQAERASDRISGGWDELVNRASAAEPDVGPAWHAPRVAELFHVKRLAQRHASIG
jgi:hypothetical protein